MQSSGKKYGSSDAPSLLIPSAGLDQAAHNAAWWPKNDSLAQHFVDTDSHHRVEGKILNQEWPRFELNNSLSISTNEDQIEDGAVPPLATPNSSRALRTASPRGPGTSGTRINYWIQIPQIKLMNLVLNLVFRVSRNIPK